jgi:hypothetical protein
MNAGQARHRSRDSEGGGGIAAAAPSIAVITSEANNPWRRMRRYGLLRRVRSSQMTAEARLATRQKSDFAKPANMFAAFKSPAQKYSSSVFQKSMIFFPHPARSEGTCARHERCGGMRWTRITARDERLNLRTAKSCGPGAPMPASSSRVVSGVKVARKPGHLGEREVSRKPLRRESRRCSGSPVVLPPCFLLHGVHGCDRHPAFPAPSFEGDVRKTRTQIAPRDCKVVAAILEWPILRDAACWPLLRMRAEQAVLIIAHGEERGKAARLEP